MAGGGSGEVLMRALADAHIPFSAGPLNIGDSDHTLALRLAREVITEQPYTPISAQVREKTRARLNVQTLLIVCPMPIGPGNLALLEEARYAAQRMSRVILFAPNEDDGGDNKGVDEAEDAQLKRSGIAERDYTQGEGVQAVRALLRNGAQIVESVGELIDIAQSYVIL